MDPPELTAMLLKKCKVPDGSPLYLCPLSELQMAIDTAVEKASRRCEQDERLELQQALLQLIKNELGDANLPDESVELLVESRLGALPGPVTTRCLRYLCTLPLCRWYIR